MGRIDLLCLDIVLKSQQTRNTGWIMNKVLKVRLSREIAILLIKRSSGLLSRIPVTGSLGRGHLGLSKIDMRDNFGSI
jgi:hypothetical protein